MKKVSAKVSSNRSFGFLFFFVFLIISFWPFKSFVEFRVWALLLSVLFLILGALNSNFLTPLNKLWHKFGIFLGRIVSPIVMGFVFFLVVTPIGLLMKLFGKDLLNIKKNNLLSTYWFSTTSENKTMKRQF